MITTVGAAPDAQKGDSCGAVPRKRRTTSVGQITMITIVVRDARPRTGHDKRWR